MEGEHRAARWVLGARDDRLKNPVVVQIPERAFDTGDIDALRRLQRDARRVALADHAETDDEIGHHRGLLGRALQRFGRADARRQAPWKELGKLVDRGYQLKKLRRRVGKKAFLAVDRHVLSFTRTSGRAALEPP